MTTKLHTSHCKCIPWDMPSPWHEICVAILSDVAHKWAQIYGFMLRFSLIICTSVWRSFSAFSTCRWQNHNLTSKRQMEEGFLSVGGTWSAPQINFTYAVGGLLGEGKCGFYFIWMFFCNNLYLTKLRYFCDNFILFYHEKSLYKALWYSQ